jgi:hypothetical protein
MYWNFFLKNSQKPTSLPMKYKRKRSQKEVANTSLDNLLKLLLIGHELHSAFAFILHWINHH